MRGLIFLLLICVTGTLGVARCPSGWTLGTNTVKSGTTVYCYKIFGDSVKNFDAALEQCQTEAVTVQTANSGNAGPGHLPECRESWQQSTVYKIMKGESGWSKIYLATELGCGLKWYHSQVPVCMTYTNWNSVPQTKPLVMDRHCTTMEKDGTWSSNDCTENLPFLCLVKVDGTDGKSGKSILKRKKRSFCNDGGTTCGPLWP